MAWHELAHIYTPLGQLEGAHQDQLKLFFSHSLSLLSCGSNNFSFNFLRDGFCFE
jgi:hypothetical protein